MSLQLLVMFSIGYIVPTSGLNFLSYGIKEQNLGYMYSLSTFAYGFSSFLVSYITNVFKKPRIMVFGVIMLMFSFILLGPSPLFFNRSLVLTSLGYTLIGFSGGFIYSIVYLVPSLPHMIEVAYSDYGYHKDDRLNDTLSGITNMSLCIGEIIGPIVSSILYDSFGYENAASIVSFIVFLFALNYLTFSDSCKKVVNTQFSQELIKM